MNNPSHMQTARAFAFLSYAQITEDFWPYKHFSPVEIACRGSGTLLLDVEAMHRLDALRTTLNRPLTVFSGYRSPQYNRRVGGAKYSFHVQGRAFDISCTEDEREELVQAAIRVGFRGFGFYATFVHVDDGPARRWTQ